MGLNLIYVQTFRLSCNSLFGDFIPFAMWKQQIECHFQYWYCVIELWTIQSRNLVMWQVDLSKIHLRFIGNGVFPLGEGSGARCFPNKYANGGIKCDGPAISSTFYGTLEMICEWVSLILMHFHIIYTPPSILVVQRFSNSMHSFLFSLLFSSLLYIHNKAQHPFQ